MQPVDVSDVQWGQFDISRLPVDWSTVKQEQVDMLVEELSDEEKQYRELSEYISSLQVEHAAETEDEQQPAASSTTTD